MNQRIRDKIEAETNNWLRSILSEKQAQNASSNDSQYGGSNGSSSMPQINTTASDIISDGVAVNYPEITTASVDSVSGPQLEFFVCVDGEPKRYLFSATEITEL